MANSPVRTATLCFASLCVCGVLSGLALAQGSLTTQPSQPTQPNKPAAPSQQAQPAQPAAPTAPTQKQQVDSNASGSRITFAETTKDFGEIGDDSSKDHIFKFTNSGIAPLEILQATGSCGCTVPALTKRTFAPGEAGEIKVSFNPHNRRDKQHTQVTVTSNDPSNPAQILHVHAFVKPLVRIDPQAISFGQIEKNKGSGSMVIFTSRKTDLRPVSVSSNNPMVTAVLEEPREITIEGQAAIQATIRVAVGPKAEVGPIQSTISVVTSDPTKSMSITVLGEVIGELALVPPRLSIGGASAKQPIATQVVVSSRYNKPFNITKIEELPAPGTPKMLSFEAVKDDTSNPPRWIVKIAGAAPEVNGAFRGEVILTTDLSGEEVVRIPYFGFVRGGSTPTPPGGMGSPTGAPQNDAWRNNPPLLMP